MGGDPPGLVLGMVSARGTGLVGAGALQPPCLLCSVCTDSSHVVCRLDEGELLSGAAPPQAGSLRLPCPCTHGPAWVGLSSWVLPVWCPGPSCSDLLCCAAAPGLLCHTEPFLWELVPVGNTCCPSPLGPPCSGEAPSSKGGVPGKGSSGALAGTGGTQPLLRCDPPGSAGESASTLPS